MEEVNPKEVETVAEETPLATESQSERANNTDNSQKATKSFLHGRVRSQLSCDHQAEMGRHPYLGNGHFSCMLDDQIIIYGQTKEKGQRAVASVKKNVIFAS